MPLDVFRQFMQQFERAGEMARAFYHRATRDRSLTRELKVLDRLLLVVGTAIMIGEFGRNFAGAFAISGLFAHRDPAMQLDLMACREPTVQHLLVQRMMEAEASRNGAVGPRDGALFTDELLSPLQAHAARLDFVRWTLERSRDSRG
jgi:hypothetical protein